MLKCNKTLASVKVVAIALTVAVATGCISAKSRPTSLATPAPGSISSGVTSWVVTAGQNLWGIAGYSEVYNANELWPLLYRNNIAQIDDADVIHPGQVLDIPRNVTSREIGAAVKHARSRGAWSAGSTEFADQEYMKKAY